MSADEISALLHGRANPEDARFLQGYFKTGSGEYGEGDRFLGIRVPVLRGLAREFDSTGLDTLAALLDSPWHEERALALMVLVRQYGLAGADRDRLHRFYLAHTARANNWDLVDLSAPTLVGAHLDHTGDFSLLDTLAASDLLWERRIAIVATLHTTRKGAFVPALHVAGLLLHDRHPLIHKAVGWMLREVGKRDQAAEEAFLEQHYREMPRTALRYAIERFSPELRRRYLA